VKVWDDRRNKEEAGEVTGGAQVCQMLPICKSCPFVPPKSWYETVNFLLLDNLVFDVFVWDDRRNRGRAGREHLERF